jgi:hypothetical protein
MPIVNHSKSDDAYKTIRYIYEKDGAQNLGGSTAGENASELSQEILLFAPLNRNVERHLYHASISLPLGYYLDDETWQVIALDFRDLMGFEGHPYGVVRHTDQEHDHIHIFIGRIGIDGQCVHDGWDHYKAQTALREIEKRYDLPELQSSWDTIEKAPNISQVRHAEQQQSAYEQGLRDRPADLSVRQQLLKAIKTSVADQPRLPEFIERLQNQGIEVKVDLSRPGISFQLQGIKFKGSSLGRGFSFNGLQKYFHLQYDAELDDSDIETLLQQPVPGAEFNPEKEILSDSTDEDFEQIDVRAGLSMSEREESTWNAVQTRLTPYEFNIELIHQLYNEALLALDPKNRLIFGTRTLDDSERSGLILTPEGTFEAINSNATCCAFWLAQNESVNRAVIVADPLEVIATYSIEQNSPQSQHTLYLAAITPEQAPRDLLKHVENVYLSTSCSREVQEYIRALALASQLIAPNPQDSWVELWKAQQLSDLSTLEPLPEHQLELD